MRTKSGCKMCKKRKVKCDESRPKCKACVKRGDDCDYSLTFSWRHGINAPFVEVPVQYCQEPVEIQTPGTLMSTNAQTAAAPIYTPSQPVNWDLPSVECPPELSKWYTESEPSNTITEITLNTPSEHDDVVTSSQTPLADSLLLDDDFDLTLSHNGKGTHKGYDILTRELLSELHLFGSENLQDLRSIEQITSDTQQEILRLLSSPIIPRPVDQTIGIIYKDFFRFFVDVTSDRLVPLPYSGNPFKILIPQLCHEDEGIALTVAAYGAFSKSVIAPGSSNISLTVRDLINRATSAFEKRLLVQCTSQTTLTMAMLLSSLEADRGNYTRWKRNINAAMEIIGRIQSHADTETYSDSRLQLHLFNLRMVAYMEAFGKLTLSSPSYLPGVKWWPSWSQGLDYLTGVDLNLLPMFAEVSNLIQERNNTLHSLKALGRINRRALYIYSKLNDYFLPQNLATDELSAMCILFQQALQIHICRRIFCQPTSSDSVRRLVRMSNACLEAFVPHDAKIQESMSFILVSIASETEDEYTRQKLMLRLSMLENSVFFYAKNAKPNLQSAWDMGHSLITSGRLSLLM